MTAISKLVVDELMAVRMFLEKHGWTQELMWDSTGAHCVMGAFLAIRKEKGEVFSSRAEDFFREQVGGCITKYNDRHDMTYDKICNKIEEVIRLAERMNF